MSDGDRPLRLTADQLRRWARITAFEPVDVRTVADLGRFVSACKQYYWGSSADTRYLHGLIDAEFERCISGEDRADKPRLENEGVEGKRGTLMRGHLRVMEGRREELERELLRRMFDDRAKPPSIEEIERALTRRGIGKMRLVGGGSQEAAGEVKPLSPVNEEDRIRE